MLPRGSLLVHDLAVLPDVVSNPVQALIARLIARANGSPCWIEIHEENTALRQQIETCLGFTYVMTKIRASSEVRGLYVSSPALLELPLPAREIPSLICLAPSFISQRELSLILQELREYESRKRPWTQHYSAYNKRHSWTSFGLRGYCPKDPGFIIKPTAMSKRWQAQHPNLLAATCRNTTAARSFPKTMEVVKRIPGRKERVRFMRLAARQGELSRHADIISRDTLGAQPSVARIHLPLVTHEDVLIESWSLRE